MFQLPFQCAKLKCGIIWAFVVISALGPQRGCHLGSAASREPGGRAAVSAAAFSRVGGGLCSWAVL